MKPDALQTVAIAGTSGQPVLPERSHPADETVGEGDAASREIESTVLLRAGARAIYDAVGTAAFRDIPPLPPAVTATGDETTGQVATGRTSEPSVESLPQERVISPKLTRLLLPILRPQSNSMSQTTVRICVSICERLGEAGFVLPSTVVVDALRTKSPELRKALRGVLGVRGRWVAASTADPPET